MPVLGPDIREGEVARVGVELNPYQERAITATGHCTILACPGSGKTRVLSVRAARLLVAHPKGRLCAVTFTRDAAEELRTRILASCGQDCLRRLAVGTFHALALAQIKRFSQGRLPRLLSEGERLAVLRRCWKQYAPGLSFDEVVQAIDAVKVRLAPRAIALSSSDFWHVLCFGFSYFPVEKSHVFIAGTVL